MEVGERDAVTGRVTTGHEWNGIKELDSPIPRIVIFFLVVTHLFAIGYWILMPAWPLGWTYTKGLLGIDQRASVERQIELAKVERAPWLSQFDKKDFAAIQADPALMEIVREAGAALFGDNCAACHGARGTGGKGFPDLTANAWLWGGAPETIAETLRIGINSAHDATRVSQMLAFGRDDVLDHKQISDVVTYVRSLGGSIEATQTAPESVARGREVFVANCVACHGENAKGNLDLGGPDLADASWINGGDRQSVYSIVYSGHQGYMPHWEERLSVVERKILVLYVLSLSEKPQ
jgi:cytochrome c oxidase cbb3-type subunit 3